MKQRKVYPWKRKIESRNVSLFFFYYNFGGKKSLKEQKVYIDRVRTFAFRFDRVIYRSFVELG